MIRRCGVTPRARTAMLSSIAAIRVSMLPGRSAPALAPAAAASRREGFA
jgi:hypothetical protein